MATVVYVNELDFDKHCHLNKIYVNKEKQFRLVKIHTSSTDRNPLRIQLDGGGRIPDNFGVSINEKSGKTMFTFNISDENEYAKLREFEGVVCSYAKGHKEEWWPSNKGIKDGQVEDNMTSLLSERKPKEDSETGEFWPSNCKTVVPMTAESEVTDCVFLDENGKPITLNDLPGRRWGKIIIELSQIYFSGKLGWGFGPKTIRFVQLAPSAYAPPSDVDFAALALPRQEIEHKVQEEETPRPPKKRARQEY